MNSNSYSLPIIFSVLLHGAIAVVLLANVDFSDKPKPVVMQASTKPIINAVAVDNKKLEQQINKIKKQKADEKAAEEKRIRDLERRAQEARKKRDAEQKRIQDLEKKRKQKEAEKKKADDAAKKAKLKQKQEQDRAKKAEAERKRKVEERKKAEKAAADAKAKRLKAEEDARKAEAERKRKAEAERKRKEKEAREAKERAEQERMMQEQLAQEQALRQQARRKQQLSEIDRYRALIVQTIQRNLLIDDTTMVGKSCKLTINLASNGFVTNVVPTGGDKVVCDASVTAIYKAQTLPVSEDPEVFKMMSKISLTVDPEF